MEWSGNFSNEEYLALAQDVSEEDTPGVVTLESFMCAARTGAVNLPPCWRKNVDGRGNRSATARDALQEGNAGCRVSASHSAPWAGQGRRRTQRGHAREAGTVI